VPETLVAPVEQLERAYLEARQDPALRELDRLLRVYVDGPHPLRARRLSTITGLQVVLKREDLAHTGAHKINNALGQACSPCAWASAASWRDGRRAARRGHGDGLCAAGLACDVYMGTDDMARQALNVFRMRLLARGCTVSTRAAAR